MVSAKIAGAFIVALPLMVLAYLMLWRRTRPVFWLAVALVMVATGYLMATGATDDIARAVMPGSVQ
ncbi:MAG: hypothetical protein ACK5JT_10530 [Hyphomicrobiaceae bacterium]